MKVKARKYLKQSYALASLALCFVLVSFLVFSSPPRFSPNRITRSASPIVQINGDPAKYIDFLFNRGEEARNFESELLDFLKFENIKKTKGFKGASNTRISLISYEFRNAKIFNAIKRLVEKGVFIRVVVDASTFEKIKVPTQSELDKWTDYNREQFLKRFSSDGKTVDKAKIGRHNSTTVLAREIHEKLVELQDQYGEQIDLTQPRHQIVADVGDNYVKLTHVKKLLLESFGGKEWKILKEYVGSANFTDACLDKRLLNYSAENRKAYFEEDVASLKYLGGSEGHIQLGAVISGGEVLEHLQGPTEAIIAAYKNGEHFDSVALPEAQLPEIVFTNPKSGNISRLQAHYSEGDKRPGAVDPNWVITKITGRPDYQIKEYYNFQFVESHKALSREFNEILSRGTLDDFFMVVDDGFSTQVFSALAEQFGAPKVNNMDLVLPTKAIQERNKIVPENFADKVMTYDGQVNIFGGPSDKNHLKVKMLIYVDDMGEERAYIQWGSANSSINAGKLNWDVLYTFDSAESWAIDFVRKVVKGMKAQKHRLFPWLNEYIRVQIVGGFQNTELLTSKKGAVDQLTNFLVTKKLVNKAGLASLIKKLKKAEVANSLGLNIVKLLEWWHGYGDLTKFDWVEFHLLTQISYPANPLSEGFVEALLKRWTSGLKAKDLKGAKISLQSILKSLAKGPSSVAKAQSDKYLEEVISNCETALGKLGIEMPVKTGQQKRGHAK